LAARGDDATVHAERAAKGAVFGKHRVGQMMLTFSEPRAHLRTYVASDALADAAVVERIGRLRHLLRLADDVVDDVVWTYQDAATALATTAVGDHFVHHLLEAGMHRVAHQKRLALGPYSVNGDCVASASWSCQETCPRALMRTWMAPSMSVRATAHA